MSSLAARRKQRAYRKRVACGVAVLRVEVRQLELAEALVASGRLSPDETLIRHAIEHQAAAILADWIKRWPVVC